MSRKRSKKPSQVDAVVEPADAVVEEEILAEGSGPLVSDEVLAEAGPEPEHVAPILMADDVEPSDAELDEIEAEASVEGDIEGAELEGEGEGEGEGDEPGATLPLAAAAMEPSELKKLIEALVFASDKPVTVQRLRQLTRVADTKRLEATLLELQADYADRGLILSSISGGWQFRTRPQFSAWVQQLIAGRPVRLTRAQLETLAIIAYRQPITRPEIDDIRGVDSSATLKLLLDRALIRILGKKEEVGRPMLYGTTKEFLDFFSLGDLRELPTLREYSELTDESRRVMTDKLGDEPDAPSEPAPVDLATDEMLGPEASAGTLSDLAEKYLRDEAQAEARDERIDVDAMPGVLADADSIEGDALAAEPLITDEIVDSADPVVDAADADSE